MPNKNPAPNVPYLPNISPSNIETIDGAFLEFIESLNVFANTNKGWSKVPVIWASAERAYQIKHSTEIRDASGALIPPIISLERGSVTKDPANKGGFHANLSPKDDRYYITKQINQEKTGIFADADLQKSTKKINFATGKKNKKVVYETYSLPIPIYVTVEYTINIVTNYQMQMNEIVQPILSHVAQNYFIIKKDNHRYECFMNPEFSQDSIGDLGEEERKYKTTIGVKVLGYYITGTDNDKDSTVKILENAVDLKFGRESSVMQEASSAKAEEQQQTRAATNVSLADTGNYVSKKTFIVGDSINSDFTLKHGLLTRDMYVSVRDNTTQELVNVSITIIDNNNILVDFGEIIPDKSFAVTIIG